MSRLGLDPLERALVAQLAVGDSRLHRLGYYAAALVPALGFGAWGIARGDVVALGLGFAGLVLFVIWNLAGEWRLAPVFASLCAKVDAFERGEPRGAMGGEADAATGE
ncbi:hypothetical protein ACQQ2N_13250 [Dokdonella sp. MW10]|uniref:hypothetical protein n=1 Tax=Dokdonella sp. MW10 TaxID=2992926 RepID=UPI003F810C44